MVLQEKEINGSILVKSEGGSMIDSMIEYNLLLHFCTSSRLSYDVPQHTEPLITAKSPCALVATKLLVHT